MKLNCRTFLRAPPASLLRPPLLSDAAAAGPKNLRDSAANGVHLHCFWASIRPPSFRSQAGRDYTLTPYLEPFREGCNDMTVISGLSHPDVGSSHDSLYSFLTAAPHPERGGLRVTLSRSTRSRRCTNRRSDVPSLALSCEGFSLSWTRSGAIVPSDSFPTQHVTIGSFSKAGPIKRERPNPAGSQRIAQHRLTRSAIRPRACSQSSASAIATSSTSISTACANWKPRPGQVRRMVAPLPTASMPPPQNNNNSPRCRRQGPAGFDLMHLAIQTDSTRLMTLLLWARAWCRRFKG